MDEKQVTTPRAETPVAPPSVLVALPSGGGSPTSTAISLKWLENFYRECGREITLAYTTLNQMKNWAIVIAGAILSGLSFSAAAGDYPNRTMFVGVVIAFVFTLRFFIRAILCYINLTRWNVIQNGILTLMLWRDDQKTPAQDEPQLAKVEALIRDLYFSWHSPVNRSTQIAANLKLGFSLLFGLCLFFLVWGGSTLATDHLVQGLLVFAVGSTLVEFSDFFTSRFFDTKEAYEKRRTKPKAVFPTPQTRSGYMVGWVLVLVLSLFISFRVGVVAWVRTLT